MEGAENDDPRAFDPPPAAGRPGVGEQVGGNPWPIQGGGGGGVRYFFAPGSGGGAGGQPTGVTVGAGPLAALMQAFNPSFLAQHNQAHEQALAALGAEHAERHAAAVAAAGGSRAAESNNERDDDPPEVPVGQFGGNNRGGNNNIGVATAGQQAVPIRNLAS